MSLILRPFYFIRHGETDWNREKRWQGSIDIPLNDTGRQQAHDAISIVKDLPIDRIVSSKLSRAAETAEILNSTLQKPISYDMDLAERDFGWCGGKTSDEVKAHCAQNPHLFGGVTVPTWDVFPEAELLEDFQKRIMTAINRHLEMFADDKILFVGHGGMYRILNQLAGNDLSGVGNATVIYVSTNEDNRIVMQPS